jgi:hypothetical protein
VLALASFWESLYSRSAMIALTHTLALTLSAGLLLRGLLLRVRAR